MIEALFAVIQKNGWLVNNLFQLEQGWRANIRKATPAGERFFEFGNGDTAVSALEDAMQKAEIETLALNPWD